MERPDPRHDSRTLSRGDRPARRHPVETNPSLTSERIFSSLPPRPPSARTTSITGSNRSKAGRPASSAIASTTRSPFSIPGRILSSSVSSTPAKQTGPISPKNSFSTVPRNPNSRRCSKLTSTIPQRTANYCSNSGGSGSSSNPTPGFAISRPSYTQKRTVGTAACSRQPHSKPVSLVFYLAVCRRTIQYICRIHGAAARLAGFGTDE